jgi:hypothetical protein
MASRFFSDRDDAQWRVWSTVPQDGRGCLPGFERGWLTFEHQDTSERRRFTPIPDDWEEAPDDRLLLWCRVAQPVRAVRVGDATAGVSPPSDASVPSSQDIAARTDRIATEHQ